MRNKPGLWFLVFIIVLMVATLFNSAGFRRLEARLLPMLVAGLVLLLAVIELVKDVRKGRAPVQEEEKVNGATGNALPLYVYEGAWIVAFFFTIYLVGFNIGTPLFVLSYLKLHGRRWPTAIIMAVVIPVVNYGMMTYFLGVHLYPGLIFG